MSVQINQYLGFGYMLSYSEGMKALNKLHSEEKAEEIQDEYHDSAFNEDIVEVNGCSMIVDGMNGKYIFFGKIFEKSQNYEHLNTMSMPKVSAKIKKNVQEQIQLVFGTDFSMKPQITLITHYR